DEVINHFPKDDSEDKDEDTIYFSLIGRPNVGKSSLVNAILNEDRVIVSNIEGTTREAVDTPFIKDDQNFMIIDTAGIRKRGKVYESVEKYSVLRALKAIDRSDVVLVLIDAETGIREQDKKIAGYAHEAGRAIVLVVNKWDTVDVKQKSMKEFEEDIRNEFQYLHYAPIIFLSAQTKKRVQRLIPAVKLVSESHSKRVATNVLNDVIMDALAVNPTPTVKGRRLKVLYTTQVAVQPPSFVVFVNDPEIMHFSYKRFLENQLREAFGFIGTPIHIIARTRSLLEEKHMSKIAVLGAGSWGTALSIVLADNNHEVRLWSHRADQVSKINDTHLNEKYVNVNLPKNIIAYSDIEAAVLNVDAILIVVPSSAIREISKTINPLIIKDVLIVHATKVIELGNSKLISEMLGEENTKVKSEDIVVLSGPSHAEEVGLRLPTTVTVASNNIKNAEDTQHLFFNENFRVYTSDDVIGVELGGALKNIIALG